jgi:prepilin-type N-terminal cleavage/methylation domain-containing protein
MEAHQRGQIVGVYDAPSRCGFTLVELLVVIGIIALLTALLMPALNRARESAYIVQCLSNQRQVGMSILMYSNENRGWYPPKTMSIRTTSVPWPQPYPWDARLLTDYIYPKYIKSIDVFYCPGDRFHRRTGCEFFSQGWADEGNWPNRISYNYWDYPLNRSMDWVLGDPLIPPHASSAKKYPTLIYYYDNASWWGNNTPILVHHPRGAYDQINYNSRGGNVLNFLCVDGSAHSYRFPYRYIGGDLTDWASPTNRNIVQYTDLP